MCRDAGREVGADIWEGHGAQCVLVCICANMCVCVCDRKRSDSDSDVGSSTADIIPQSTTCFSLSLRPSSFLWRSPVPRPGQTRARLSDSDHSAV